jgi:protein-tyrosine phosphatase
MNAFDVKRLKELEITAVMNLQTDEDLKMPQLNWGELAKAYQQFNIQLCRYPIVDFDPVSLSLRLDGGINELESLLNNNQIVYLHCTAGLNRSPTVAIAYFHKKKKMTVDEALRHVSREYPCQPYLNVIR